MVLSRIYFLFPLIVFCFMGCGAKEYPVQRVLLITIDTVRADALNCYDLPLPAAHTPNLDQLAGDGTLYRRAACNIPATLTSHTSILTGRLPRSTGVRFAKDLVAKENETIAETLKMEGYSTAAFLSAVVLNKLYGLDQGFDVYEDLSDSAQTEAERSAEDTTDMALEWLRQRTADEPFFLWVHYYDPHSPYQPPAEYDRYGPEGYSGNIDGSADQVSRMVASKGQGVSEADLQRLRALYLGEVEYMDHHIGRLIQGFDAVNDDEKNMIVTLADHGENLGEHGRYFHGADLYGQSMHIPFMIRWPEGEHSGTEVSELVQGIDVAPTILSTCGISAPMNIEGIALDRWFDPNVDRSSRTALLETEDEYRSDANKVFGAEISQGRFIDKRFHRRSPVLVGRSVQVELTDSCFLQAWVKGDPTIELAAHIRFHTGETFNTNDTSTAANLPTIMVRTSRFGLEAIHQVHPVDDVREANPGWTPVASPDLYERAVSYGKTQGWKFEHIVLESVAVDAAGIPGQTRLDAYIDQVELVGKQAQVLNDFETIANRPYQDAGVGERKVAGSQIEAAKGINNSKALHVAAAFEPESNLWDYTKYYPFENAMEPYDETNILSRLSPAELPGELPEEAKSLAKELEDWLRQKAGQTSILDKIDPAQEEKLRSLGYF